MPTIEEIQPGQSASWKRTVTDDDIRRFAALSGDDNPVHLDADFAAKTRFKGRIAHGMLAASFISTVVGTKLPGYGCIYISQNLRFRAPVRIGDTVETTATVAEVDREKKRVRMETVCKVGDTVVIEGEATPLVPSKD